MAAKFLAGAARDAKLAKIARGVDPIMKIGAPVPMGLGTKPMIGFAGGMPTPRGARNTLPISRGESKRQAARARQMGAAVGSRSRRGPIPGAAPRTRGRNTGTVFGPPAPRGRDTGIVNGPPVPKNTRWGPWQRRAAIGAGAVAVGVVGSAATRNSGPGVDSGHQSMQSYRSPVMGAY